ncbi:MAG: glucoamylase family protein [Desulfuromonadales bacterium]|nr:glucoamylase family protein [Desulfuromonadales bacterium]
MSDGVLIAYFVRQSDARRALWELGKRGFFRAAVLHKTADNRLLTNDPFLRRRLLGIFFAILGFSAVGAVLTYFSPTPPDWLPHFMQNHLVPIGGGAVTGLLVGLMILRREHYGVTPQLLVKYSGSLFHDETALVLQAPVAMMGDPVTLLREKSTTSPTIFVLHPRRERRRERRDVTPPVSGSLIEKRGRSNVYQSRGGPQQQRNALLKKLKRARSWVQKICSALTEASRLGQGATPVAEWIIDNEYLIVRTIRDVLLNLPKSFYRQLPRLASDPERVGMPYIYSLAKKLVAAVELRLTTENILAHLAENQLERTLSIAELWAFPQMLRVALIESIQGLAVRSQTDLCESQEAAFWANRLIVANRSDVNQLFTALADLAMAHPQPSPYFGAQLVDLLYDETTVLVSLQGWLERSYGSSLNDLIQQEQHRQASDQLAIGNAFTSLRQLVQLDWRTVFEASSRVEQILKRDPAGIYAGMDFETRDRYRQAVEEFANRSRKSEEAIARAAVDSAQRARKEGLENPLLEHVGAYLIGAQRQAFVRQTGCREYLRCRLVSWVRRHHTPLYFGTTGGLVTLLIGLLCYFIPPVTPAWWTLAILLSALFLTSQLAIEVVNYLATRVLPPDALAKLDFSETGIPDRFRTLVVVPTLLINEQVIKSEIEKLEIRFMANRQDNLLFSLFTDFTDAVQEHIPEDDALIALARAGIEELNQRHGPRFLLFHRQRSWCSTEKKYIGWERKRGKLEQLNRLLVERREDLARELIYVGEAAQLTRIRFVITLDSDTQLPHGSARRMIETLAHPLNQPRFAADGSITSGYTLIQPRVTPSLPSSSYSLFSRLFCDAVGVDPYTRVVSDIYQDLTGEGSYHGKGIYDVRAFEQILDDLFPEGLILSHDLLEGAHARVGLASDIELYDEFPPDYLGYVSRMHRWIRGDWQIAAWVLPRVPRHHGRWGKNPLSLFNRWKVFDNLRRSLLPVMNLVLLVAVWLLDRQLATMTMALFGVMLFFSPLTQLLNVLTRLSGWQHFSFSALRHTLVRICIEIALMPHQAAVALGAILRVWYRLLISHRGLLEWTSSQAVKSNTRRRWRLIISLGGASLFAGALARLMMSYQPESLSPAAPWLLLWAVAPLCGWLVTLPPRPARRQTALPDGDRLFLRRITRRTWRYFDDFVNVGTFWLPPDNYQVSHQDQLAMRTSPTNIGLWLLSAQGAHDCGYLTPVQVIDRLSATIDTLNQLERYQGHLLNWYDINTLKPLEPRYVSAVDSGNFLAALWTLDQGLDELFRKPLLSGRVLSGLRDTAGILREVAGQSELAATTLVQLDELVRKLRVRPAAGGVSIPLLGRCTEQLDALLHGINTQTSADGEAFYWGNALAGQLEAWQTLIDSCLGWYEPLKTFAADLPHQKGAQSGAWSSAALSACAHKIPSLAEIADDRVAAIALLRSWSDSATTEHPVLVARGRQIVSSFDLARTAATAIMDKGEALRSAVQEISSAINMAFLFDRERKLFSIGYNVSAGVLDNSFYDLLASEARLGSYVAVARGDVPMEHWFAMGRSHAVVGGRKTLLSWSGTMFEYLMPQLLQKSYDNSLIDRAVRRAVEIQIRYGRHQGVPWGISESAYGDLDFNKTYQYMAFGVPHLGLKRILKNQLVVAPYASLLAVGLRPHETVSNLRRLKTMGLLSTHGYFESVDFSRDSERGGVRGVIIRAYMAHHQGMGFLALINFLHHNPFPERFHADPRVRAFEPLLQEKIPVVPPLKLIATRESTPLFASAGESTPAAASFSTPHTYIPKTRLLSNGKFNLMLTNTGGGYSQWQGQELTRWRSDRTCDCWGSFCYIHDPANDLLWSAAYHPVGSEGEEYLTDFALDGVIYRRLDHGIRSEMEVIVSPEDDVEIRRITLFNRSDERRQLSLTSYMELALAAHSADRQHPAFSKLFIHTEALSDRHTLLAQRRQRGPDDATLFVAHRVTVEGADGAFNYETDRHRFIGRGNTLAAPRGATRKLCNSAGFVLDPIFSLRHEIVLEPSQRTQVSFILAVAESRDAVLALTEKYGEVYQVNRALEFAWRSTQIGLRLLHIQADEARWFQHLANHMIFPNQLLSAPGEQIRENHKGQSGLWPYGISGDLPILLVTIGETRDLNLIRQLLQAHSYWRTQGFVADLVILNEEVGSYDQPLRERLINLIQAYSPTTGRDRFGGVFLRSADEIPADDQRLLKAVASVMLVAARGPLAQQLGVPRKAADPPALLETRLGAIDPPRALPPLELVHSNGFGGFTAGGREYVIDLGRSVTTPAPWVNVIANRNFGTMVSESGGGFTWFGNSQRNRLTPWANDPVSDPPGEVLYLRDDVSGELWTPTIAPIREDGPYRVRHGAGYTLFEHHSHGLAQELLVFVPTTGSNADAGDPVKLQQLYVRNDSPRRRKISLTYYVELTLGEHAEASRLQTITYHDRRTSALFAFNRYHPDYSERVTFVALDPQPDSWCGDRVEFIGRNRTLATPEALERETLNNRTGERLDPCAALQVAIELEPGEERTLTTILGQAGSQDEARWLIETYSKENAFVDALAATGAWWESLLGGITVSTPEPAADLLINRWLLYQSLSCRIWGRSALYQSGGAFGFRDQLQDVTAFLAVRPELAREQIKLAASRQFPEGDVQHWWHPPGGAGIRSRISDDLLWLPLVTAHYVRVTGDVELLGEEVPFLNTPLLEDGQHEAFTVPEVMLEPATIFEHCRRALEKGFTRGPNGLPLIGTGDWNDGMNLVGAEGRGESVWLGWFLVDVLQGMTELAVQLDRSELVADYRQRRVDLIARIEAVGWDGEWYLRGTFDDGSPLGSARCSEAQIDSLPQSWAWLTGAADPARATQALDAAWDRLVRVDESLVQLFDPPFEHADPSPGYIKGYPPGVRENGGQYTHAALWFAMALARKGDGERAVQMLKMLSPVELAADPEKVARYGVEPYVVAADVYRLPGRVGRGGWSWYTGSAAWMYRAWVEEILGLKVRGTYFVIEPVIPASWPGFTLSYRCGEALYTVTVENPDRVSSGVAQVTRNGEILADQRIPLSRDEGEYAVMVRMG